jgi:RNA recognition motif-containing protein
MGNRLYVGNLSFRTVEDTLLGKFAAVGEVREVRIPTDRETGQSRGFAYVTMASDQAASDAIEKLDGSEVDGSIIKVNEALERR